MTLGTTCMDWMGSDMFPESCLVRKVPDMSTKNVGTWKERKFVYQIPESVEMEDVNVQETLDVYSEEEKFSENPNVLINVLIYSWSLIVLW